MLSNANALKDSIVKVWKRLVLRLLFHPGVDPNLTSANLQTYLFLGFLLVKQHVAYPRSHIPKVGTDTMMTCGSVSLHKLYLGGPPKNIPRPLLELNKCTDSQVALACRRCGYVHPVGNLS